MNGTSQRTGFPLSASAAAPSVPFFTPQQSPPAGTALDLLSDDEAKRRAVPTLFQPLQIRGMTLTNRIAVSPMSMYSANMGHATDFHLVHLGQFAMRGAALTMVGSTAVTKNGRISPEDLGLWEDTQVAPLKRIVDFVHSQGQKVGVQLQHSGRKGSTLAPWNVKDHGASQVAEEAVGGWPDDVWAPSAIPMHSTFPTPKALSAEAVKLLVKQYGQAARRALLAGFGELAFLTQSTD
jgi:2,4-dienoyl-CoA reductase-like NADH-dependent reductase (Old Yellow Enzyme family)